MCCIWFCFTFSCDWVWWWLTSLKGILSVTNISCSISIVSSSESLSIRMICFDAFWKWCLTYFRFFLIVCHFLLCWVRRNSLNSGSWYGEASVIGISIGNPVFVHGTTMVLQNIYCWDIRCLKGCCKYLILINIVTNVVMDIGVLCMDCWW